jgi:hypothetical protein
MESTRDELRQAVARLGRRGRGRSYPEALLDQIVAYVASRRREGATLVTIGEEIGVSWKSLSRWVAKRRPARHFRRVQVVAPVQHKMIVRAAHGLCIEGLDMDGLAELIRKLDT